ncbi:asparagine synthetase B family protein [Motiliproteus coralliicola]|uniref:asparagine synthetase B family protein n=1 Tax=Motiliproteus coralliicola TaxID=2283196 RepID=UPI001403BC4D|nr:asparagine synthase-related protein [Motiliproteus coralliicola]
MNNNDSDSLAEETDLKKGSQHGQRPIVVVAESLSGDQVCIRPEIEVYCFGLPRNVSRQPLSASQLAELFQQDKPPTLVGHFALVVCWPQQNRCLMLADRFATHRLYYAADADSLVVSERLEAVRRHRPDSGISQQALVNYLFFHMIPSPETVYRGIHCLEPAQRIQWKGGDLQRDHHWVPRFDQTEMVEEPQQAEKLLATMRELMPEYSSHASSGCFLSGGLDSSSVAGLVAEQRRKTDVFSIGFPIEQYNELDYARTAVQHFGLTGHEYEMSPQDVVDALPQVIASMDQPFGNSSVMPAYFCARLAKSKGIDCLIAGDGGDELFAGNERYSKQLQLDRLRQRLKPLIWLMDLTILRPPWPESVKLFGKARSLTQQLKMTVPQNLEYFNFLNLIERQEIFSDAMLQATDQQEPDRRCQQLFDQLEHGDTLDRMLFMDWKHTLADNDLVKVNSMCRLAGVDVAYPMLDDRLVDFSLRVPGQQKLTPANLRHLYKMAMTGFLPDKIINKPKHGFGLPFGLWTVEHQGLRGLAYEAIASLDQLDLFNPGFIDDVIRRHQREHAKHYGELVWILMVLALWLDRHQ